MRLVLLVALAGCATARPGGQRAFVESVYRAHDPSRPGPAPWEPERCRQTFTARLCELIARDRREAGDEVPRLDGDPLYDAQDFELSDLTFEDAGDDRVEVSFVNAGHPRRVVVRLVREGGGWRIDDLVYLHERPVRTLSSWLTQ